MHDFAGVSEGSGQNAGANLTKPGVESLASSPEFIGNIASASTFNLYQVSSIDLEFLVIKAAGQSCDKIPYRKGYRDLLCSI